MPIKKSARRTLGIAVVAGVVAATAPAATVATSAGDAHAEEAGHMPEQVILIDWDGFDPAVFERVDTPNLDRLANLDHLGTGTSTFHTVSNPARASISTGAYPVTHNNVAYYFDDQANQARGQERHLEAETIAEALARQGRTVASVQWYMVQDHGTAFGDPEHLYVQPGGDFGDRVDVAIDILNQRPVDSDGTDVTVPEIPDLLAVYGDELDSLAHQHGADHPAVDEALAQMDADLGRLVQATRDLGIYGDTAFILTSDHGMTSWNQTLLPQVREAVQDAGYVPEIVTPCASPAEDTEVVIVPSSVRVGDITLRGAADSEQGQADVRAALESLSPELISQVFDRAELDEMRASAKLGDLVAEAEPPYGFALGEPDEGEWQASHGSTRELQVPFLVSGAGFRPVALEEPSVVDVAPTIAALLGVDPPEDADGRVLREAMLPNVGGRAPPGRR